MVKQTLMAVAALLFSATGAVLAQDIETREDLLAVFEAHGATGSFAVLDVTANRLTLVGAERAQQRFIPASTFKIANSLIALETGSVADAHEIIPYGGQPQPIAAWEQDMSIRDAMRASNVPVFQTVARRVGRTAYTDYLARLDFGNGQVGEEVDRFWLSGPLAISAAEYTGFLSRLARQELPLSTRSQAIVRDITRLETRGDAMLHGKTGWTTAPDPGIGWFVGWVERNGTLHSFALNIDMRDRADAPKRTEIAGALLAELGIY